MLLRTRDRHAGLTDDSTLKTLLLDEPVAQLLALGEVSDSADNLNRTYLSPAHKRAAVLVSMTYQITPCHETVSGALCFLIAWL